MTTVTTPPQCAEIAVRIDRGGESTTLDIACSADSCWASLLGPWPVPEDGSIDAMDRVLGDGPADGPAGGPAGGEITRVTLAGCPSGCLLPLLWLRTIWCARPGPGTSTECVLDWARVEDHAGARGRQAAGMLACALADRVVCGDPTRALAVWGVDTGAPAPAEEAFDLLTNIIDQWDSDLQHMTLASDWSEAVRRALLNCAMLGRRRVALYGAGTHTRGVGDALMEPGVEIVCLIDDDSRRHGDRLWGYEIVSREDALGRELDAVIISANSIEDLLWERAGVFRERGVVVTRLYG